MATLARYALRSLARASSRFLVRVDHRAPGAPGSHEDFYEATAPIPAPSPPSSHGCGSNNSATVTMKLAAEPKGGGWMYLIGLHRVRGERDALVACKRL